MTTDAGAFRQTIFYPFLHASTFGRGTVLHTLVKSPVYDSVYGDAPYVDCVGVIREEQEELVFFAVNKDTKEGMEVTCDLRQFSGYQVEEHIVLHDDDLLAVNTMDHPGRVQPVTGGESVIEKGILTARLLPASWNVIRLKRMP